METEDSFDESQGSSRSVKGKRGVLWGNAETSALIKVWGEAEIKYALSSLKRNYEIFELISAELSKVGFSRSAEECRTKTKSLRKLYKQAVLHNNTSGSGRSKFIWYDEMSQIFRTDPSIHPHRTTESVSAPEPGGRIMQEGEDALYTLELFPDQQEGQISAGSDVSASDQHPLDNSEPSTSGCSTGKSVYASVSETPRNSGNVETTNFEATLDPARRLALLRKRKQRASAASRLDNTLSGFVNWVQRTTDSNIHRRSTKDESEEWFQKEVISNLRVASSSLKKLTEYITSSPRRREVRKNKVGKSVQSTVSAPRGSESESQQLINRSSESDTDSDLEGIESESLLDPENLITLSGDISNAVHSTPCDLVVMPALGEHLTTESTEAPCPSEEPKSHELAKISKQQFKGVITVLDSKTREAWANLK